MHRIAIHFRPDQYQWLMQQKRPGKSISHYIRDLVDSDVNAANLEGNPTAACDAETA